MLSSIVVSFGLISLGLAVPTLNDKSLSARTWSPQNSCYNSSANANFDDLGFGTGLIPVPTPYMGLLFQGFNLLTPVKTSTTPGVIPHSGNNDAISGARTTTTAGSAEWTTNYANSVVKTFSPKSFYYGCALTLGNPAAAGPIACNIAITGFVKGDNTNEAVQVAAQGFSYNPSTTTGAQQMVMGTFNSQFKDLQYVLVQYSLVGGLAGANPDLDLVIDDVKYDYCT